MKYSSNKPLFSVLMANYNKANYLKEAIESVIAQTYKNWELIIVDDASADNSLSVIEPYLKDKRIKLIALNRNLGSVGATKRLCLEKSQGDILGILDSDDALHKDALKVIVKAYKDNPDCGWIHSTYYECDSSLKPIKVKDFDIGKNRLKVPDSYHFNTFKRAAYNLTAGFNPKLRVAEDHDLDYKLEELTKLKFIGKPLYCYRMHKGGISQGKQRAEGQFYTALAKYNAYKRRLNTNLPNLTKQEISNILFYTSYLLLRNIQLKRAMILLFKLIRLRILPN
jgi:glycosyltransferase involved in cell wall biosynthesis